MGRGPGSDGSSSPSPPRRRRKGKSSSATRRASFSTRTSRSRRNPSSTRSTRRRRPRTSGRFPLAWSGADDLEGSGIASFTIHVSRDGGPFAPFLANTRLTSASFPVEPGHHYAFYSTARDHAGNEERPPVQPDAETTTTGGNDPFRRGDTNGDALINITDAIFHLNHLFLGGLEPPCADATDANDDARSDISDGVFILRYLFVGGTPRWFCSEDVRPDPTPIPSAPAAIPAARAGSDRRPPAVRIAPHALHSIHSRPRAAQSIDGERRTGGGRAKVLARSPDTRISFYEKRLSTTDVDCERMSEVDAAVLDLPSTARRTGIFTAVFELACRWLCHAARRLPAHAANPDLSPTPRRTST
jgi:hypothetical protein